MSYQVKLNENQRLVDYLVVVGLPVKRANNKKTDDSNDEDDTDPNNQNNVYNFETIESINSRRIQSERSDPIVDIVILNKSLNEIVPHGFECLWLTKAGHTANLNYSDSLFKTQHEMFICIRRGRDKPPITDVGVFYEGSERVMNGCFVISKTVGGSCANVNNSSLTADRIFITYRRSGELACNSLAVIDICVIIKSKGELAPHTFLEIPKNLNRGIFGASIFLCYKKAWISAPQIKYLPTALFRYPLNDHSDLPLPKNVETFGLPMGAVIESWPKTSNLNNINTKPSLCTFVLNVTGDDGCTIEKVYGASIIFYELYNDSRINGEQALVLEFSPVNKTLHSNKCLMLLSRHPLFDSLKEFLMFLYNNYTKSNQSVKDLIPIEKYLAHMIFDVPFPKIQKPRVLVHLTDREEDCLSIRLPEQCALPQSGASFIDFLTNFGVDNSINVFILVLLQRNIMIHSLRRAVLTGVIEAVSCIIFPFIWSYFYLPMCPLNLCQLIEAPGSFILGMDSRYFDLFDPPNNVTCIDLDTNTLSWTNERNIFNLKILPRKQLNALQNRLRLLFKEIEDFRMTFSDTKINRIDQDPRFKRKKRYLELSIREAFLRFMASILCNYKQFLRTVTSRPDSEAMDRNLAKFFDCEGFVQSKEKSNEFFYRELIKTQLFYDFIMNLSFATESESNLAESFDFFAECCSKVLHNKEEDRLLDLNESNNPQTIVILPPLVSEDDTAVVDQSLDQGLFKTSSFVYNLVNSNQTFPRLKCELGLADTLLEEDLNNTSASSVNLNVNNNNNNSDTQSISSAQNLLNVKKQKIPSTPIGVRTNAEKMLAQKRLDTILKLKPSNSAKLNDKNRYNSTKAHAMCLLSNAYALWFIYLADCLKTNEEACKAGLKYAFQVLNQMQNHNLKQPDEICYRTMMQLCLLYKLPTLAVKTLLHMKKFKIELTPITYSYYNKACIEPSNWPSEQSFEQKKWAKIRLFWSIIWAFKTNLKLKQIKEERLRKQNRKNKKPHSSSRKKLATLKSRTQLVNTPAIKINIIEDTLKKEQNKCEASRVSTNSQRHSNIYNDKSMPKRQLKYSFSETPDKMKLNEEIKKANKDFQTSFQLIRLLCSDEKISSHFNFSNDLISKEAGILTMSVKLSQKLVLLKNNSIERSNLFKSLDLKINLEITFDTNQRKETFNDPLGAFIAKPAVSKESIITNEIIENQLKTKEINKRLFDYKPFAIDEQKEVLKSDFIFQKPQVNQLDSDVEYENSDACEEESEESDEYYEEDNDDETDDDEDESFDDEQVFIPPKGTNKSNLSYNGTIESGEDSNNLIENCVPISTLNTQYDNNLLNTPVNSNKKQTFTTPNTATVTSLFSTFRKKIENSVDINRLKGILSDKSSEIKEAIMTNVSPLNQQDITNKIKSFSNYQLYTNPYVNSFTKSPSNQFTSKNFQSNLNKTPPSASSQNSSDTNSSTQQPSLDLEPFQVDESFEQLTIKWWGFEYDGRKINEINKMNNDLENILIDIQISSCNYCDNCRTFLYDEEIMSGWTFNESDLNIKCSNCLVPLVPKLYISIKDLDSIRKYLITEESNHEEPEVSHPFNEENVSSKAKKRPCSQIILNTNDFTVQYLSPLVVRKEIENIILHKKEENQNETLIDAKFMDEHSVVYWNLIWYFKRIGVDSGYLLDSLLNSRVNALKSQLSTKENEFKFVSNFQNKIAKPYHKHQHVRLKCMWDNLKLQNSIKNYEVPLYLSWLNSENMNNERLITILSQTELKSLRKSSANPRSLAKLFELIIRNIKECDVGVPIKNLLRERYIARTNYSSIYREILFLVLIGLERYLIDIDAFDSEYRKAYKKITSNEQSPHLFKAFDKPPSNLAVWCRRLFSPLNL